MDEIPIGEFCDNGSDIADRVQAGESFTVTRSGEAVAELRPLPRRPLDAATLLERWRHLEPVDPVRFRADIDSVLDPSL